MGEKTLRLGAVSRFAQNESRKLAASESPETTAKVNGEVAKPQVETNSTPSPSADIDRGFEDDAQQTKEFTFDSAKPYAIISGEPGVRYVQDTHFFNQSFEYVREAYAQAVPVIEAKKAPTLRERLAGLRGSAVKEIKRLGDVDRLPAPVIDAAKENAQALRAERLAD